ncbi:MAG TPA: small nuclear ribonucleoprotein [Thermoplasmata archaeon]|jgi:small nuclear ribonucleoprotein|nr:small nuclear ribonucleoprotein [Thermoplasmata archaeon]
MPPQKKTADLLNESLNKRILVELKGNREYRGILEGYDHPHMNLVLRNAEEAKDGEIVRKIDRVIIRGDNIIYISP